MKSVKKIRLGRRKTTALFAGVALLFGLAFYMAKQDVRLFDSDRFTPVRKELPPVTLQLPKEKRANILVRRFGEEQWTPASEKDTSELGVYEIKQINATTRNKISARDLVSRSMAVAIKNDWFDYERGREDGYQVVSRQIGDLHYINRDYTTDNTILNPEKPEALMYYPTPEGMVLAGVMYLANSINHVPPPVEHDNAYWHIHRDPMMACFKGALPETLPDSGVCPDGFALSNQSPFMIHVWFVDHPDGPFGTEMCLPDDVLLAPPDSHSEQ